MGDCKLNWWHGSQDLEEERGLAVRLSGRSTPSTGSARAQALPEVLPPASGEWQVGQSV